MGKELFNHKFYLHNYNESLASTLHIFDFPVLIETMKHKKSYAKGELDAMILMKTPDKQILLTAIHEGTEIKSFQSNDSITIQILEGKLTFHILNEFVNLEKGQLLTLHENIKYSLKTTEETVLLLIIVSSALQLSVN